MKYYASPTGSASWDLLHQVYLQAERFEGVNNVVLRGDDQQS